MSDRSAELDARREVVEQELGRALGNASLCSVSRSAGSVPAAKHLEGRLAALRDLRRALRRGEQAGEAVVRLAADWEAERFAAVPGDDERIPLPESRFA